MIRGTSRARPGSAVGKTSYIYNVFRNETQVAKPDPFAENVEGFVEGRGGRGSWVADIVKSVMRDVRSSTPREKRKLQQHQPEENHRKSRSKHRERNRGVKVSVATLGRSSSDRDSSPRRRRHRHRHNKDRKNDRDMVVQ